MASTSETGHAKNVANFDELISFVKGYGTAYNPSKASLCLLELQNLSTRAKNAIDAHIIWQGHAVACPYNHNHIISRVMPWHDPTCQTGNKTKYQSE